MPVEVQPAAPAKRKALVRRLVISVNLALAVVLVLYQAWDYRDEWNTHLLEQRLALDAEARTLLPVALRLRRRDLGTLQNFVNEVSAAARPPGAHGYDIAVRVGKETYAAEKHGPSQRVLALLDSAANRPDRTVPFGNGYLIVGRAAQEDVVVYVGESLATIEQILRAHLVTEVVSIVGLGIALGIVLNLVLRRVLARPLKDMVGVVRRFGGGDLTTRMPPTNTAELGLLADEFDHMAGSIEKAEAARRLRMRKAQRIQAKLCPDLSAVEDVRFACIFRPAAEVAGDYYDVLRLGDGALLLCVADVTGHDVPAAMGAAMLKALLQTSVERENQPARLLESLNAAFSRVTLPEDFATMILARWDPAARTLSFASAGHTVAYAIRTTGELQELPSTGPPLGIDSAAQWSETNLRLGGGDRLIMVTDGILEAASPSGDPFGSERFIALIKEAGTAPLDALPDRLTRSIAAHCGSALQEDDMTMLAVGF